MIRKYNTLSISEAVFHCHFLLHIIWFTTIWIAFNVGKGGILSFKQRRPSEPILLLVPKPSACAS